MDLTFYEPMRLTGCRAQAGITQKGKSMKRLLVPVLGAALCLLGPAAVASPGSAALLGATLQTMLAETVQLTVVHNGTGDTNPAAGTTPVTVGDPLELIADTASSYFGGWHMDIGGGGTVIDFLLPDWTGTVPADDLVATASFSPSGVVLYTDISGDGWINPPVGSYKYALNLDVPITALPDPGTLFDHWDDGHGNNVGTGNPTHFTTNAGGMRIAVFKPGITGGIVINENNSTTKSTAATLGLTWSGGAGTGAVRMRFSDDGAHWTAWEPLKTTRAHTLPAGDGYKTVRVQYLDQMNNRSAVFSDFIRLDATVPTGSIIINGGASGTVDHVVSLGLTWNDGSGSGVNLMRFSDDGAHWTDWMPVVSPYTYLLPGPNGYNTVRVQYRDRAGNYSAVCSDYIRLIPLP